MELTRRQRNDLFRVLLANGVDPQACTFGDPHAAELRPPMPPRTSIRHLTANPLQGSITIGQWATKSRFTIEHDFHHRNPGSFYKINSYVGPVHSPPRSCTWRRLLKAVAAWAQEVRYEDRMPDLWEELRKLPEVLTTAHAGESSNAPFSPDEKAEVGRRLDQARQFIRAQPELTGAQAAAFEKRLEETAEAARHQGRRDWLMLFYGSVMSTFMTDAIPPHIIQTVLTTVVHGIAHLFGIGGPAPTITA